MTLPLNSIDTVLLAGIVFVFLIYRQSVTRVFTWRDLLLPAAGALYIALRYFPDHESVSTIVVEIGAIAGIASGLITGHLVQVWRDTESDFIYQRGGWRYAAVLTGLLVVHAVWYLAASALNVETALSLVNDTFICVALGNHFGRTLHIGTRALHIGGWKLSSIPTKRSVVKQRR